MRRVIADVRFALRTLRRAPLFTTLAVLSIALGIGANTAIFTLVDQVVLRPLPIPTPDQLVQLRIDGTFSGNTWGDGSELSYPMYQDIRDRNTAFSGVCARFEWPMHLSGGGATERVNGELVSGTYFPVLGVGSARGRVITPADDRLAGAMVPALRASRINPLQAFARRLTRFRRRTGARGRVCLARARRLICASEPEPQHARDWHRPAAARVIQVLEPRARQPFALRQVGVIPQPALDAEAEPR
jgi:hypothetical protein